MELKLNEEKIKELLSGAILKELGENQRDVLIAQSISYLLSEQKRGEGYYAEKFIPLHEAFNKAVKCVANKVVLEYVENNEEIKQKIKDLFAEGAEQLFTKHREKILEAMAEAFARGFKDADEY